MDEQLRYFELQEFACKHCGSSFMEESFLLELDELRNRYGRPLVITSGYRCPAYNNQVSSTGFDGPHTTGRAVDLRVAHADAFNVLRLATGMRFSGIGIAQKGTRRFIHLDDLPATPGRPRPTVWSY